MNDGRLDGETIVGGRLVREDVELLRGQLGLDLRTYVDDPDSSVEARLTTSRAR